MSKRSPSTVNRQPSTNYYWIVGLATILVLFGLVMVTSASQIIAFGKYRDSLYFFKRQIAFALGGFIIFFLMSRIDYRKLRQASWPLAITCLVLLAMVFIPAIGHRAGGSSRWIPLGFFNFQPSELAKLGSILLTVYILDKQKLRFDDIKDLTPFLTILVMAALVIAQPDMGTTILILTSCFGVIFIGGLQWRFVLGSSFAGGILGFALVLLEPYRFKRLISFLRPEANSQAGGFQISQSLIAIGSGGLTGTGLAMSKQKFFFLPAAHTDFIFAIVGEELGIMGALSLVVIFALLAIRGFSIAYNTEDRYGKFLAIGLTIMVAGQAMVNMGAVVGLMPITGVPLPLISYGGSSLLVTMAALGILAAIAKNKNVGRVSQTRR